MKPNSTFAPANSARPLMLWACFAAALIGSGCGHISELSEAQTLYNQASSMHNEAIFQDADLSKITKENLQANLGHSTNHALANPKVLYAEARDRLKRLDNANDTRRLQRDGLMGHKLTLEALCQLELGNFAEARDAAARAKAEAERAVESPGRTPPEKRDQLLWRAMPGLIGLKEAWLQLDPVLKGTAPTDEDWIREFQRLLIGPRDDQGQPAQVDDWNALDLLGQARQEGGNHPVCTYFTMCQLSAFRYLQQAYQAGGTLAGSQMFNGLFEGEVRQLLKQLEDDLPLRAGRSRNAPLVPGEQEMLGAWYSFFGYTP